MRFLVYLPGPFLIPFLSEHLLIASLGTADIVLWGVENGFGWIVKDMAKAAKTDATTRQQIGREDSQSECSRPMRTD